VKRSAILLLLALLSAIGVLTSPAGARRAHSAFVFHSVEVRKSKLGKILENSAGSILYEFTLDKPKKDRCAAITGCSKVWVAQPAEGTLSAGPGAKKSLISSIKLSNGGRQLTYAGHPLYIYLALPTSTSYVGAKQFGGHWYALNAKGKPVK
jgi:predicted lipoprotein with Yx(FWY)xxD motif